MTSLHQQRNLQQRWLLLSPAFLLPRSDSSFSLPFLVVDVLVVLSVLVATGVMVFIGVVLVVGVIVLVVTLMFKLLHLAEICTLTSAF